MRKMLIVFVAFLCLLMVIPTAIQAGSSNKAKSTINKDEQAAQDSADKAESTSNKDEQTAEDSANNDENAVKKVGKNAKCAADKASKAANKVGGLIDDVSNLFKKATDF